MSERGGQQVGLLFTSFFKGEYESESLDLFSLLHQPAFFLSFFSYVMSSYAFKFCSLESYMHSRLGMHMFSSY